MHQKTFFFSLLFFMSEAFSAPLHQIHEHSIHQKTEQIGDTIFVARHELVNGTSTHTFTMNGKRVNELVYQEGLLRAEMELRRKEREDEDLRLARDFQAKNDMSLAINKKLLGSTITQIERELRNLEHRQLRSFLLFDTATFADQATFDAIMHTLVPKARALLANEASSADELARIADQIADVPQRLRDLFYASAQNAITLCSDTKMLKELLEIVS